MHLENLLNVLLKVELRSITVFAYAGLILGVNNSTSFSPSLQPFGLSAPPFMAWNCSQEIQSAYLHKAPLAALYPYHFPSSLSSVNKNNVSLSVTPSLVVDPSSTPCQSLRSGKLLVLSFLRSSPNFCSQESIDPMHLYGQTGSNPAHRYLLAFTSYAARPCAAPPSFGPSARRPSWPWARRIFDPHGLSPHPHPLRTRAAQTRLPRTGL